MLVYFVENLGILFEIILKSKTLILIYFTQVSILFHIHKKLNVINLHFPHFGFQCVNLMTYTQL